MYLIVAVDANWAIGKGGDQLCYIPADLKRFQQLTTGHPVLLGRKTLQTFPGGRPLKNRRNLILSSRPDFAPEGGEVFPTLEAALAQAGEDTFVIGGESIYRQTLDQCQVAYVTRIHHAFPGADTFFPDLDQDPAWGVVEKAGPFSYQDLTYSYVTYRRL
ncbi:MAG: dihydrofolate reductase [Evtepia sp.]|uniref:dihydrofolate reductase n=1 Tax=Evtepia sp. TaxID=2773933 RepID=UPI002A76580A|nr:dihydrofolate reductase [Evtepia sp.]MDY3013892.1 dihydrofolate reductase [Evtepia sp.]